MLQKEKERLEKKEGMRDTESRQCVKGSDVESDRCRNKTTEEVILIHKRSY